jgi:hypothetical protein
VDIAGSIIFDFVPGVKAVIPIAFTKSFAARDQHITFLTLKALKKSCTAIITVAVAATLFARTSRFALFSSLAEERSSRTREWPTGTLRSAIDGSKLPRITSC